ncbi:unnamed protein product [Mytilus edulis]|uniref:Up-regulator of cell proliferation-like domain-containing protein n=1 Tax=Mytilus edulis TaxID=6550 RepID=A0A8S3QWV8_MYTED|nr:unnamed protein product [Mytilus edulis]
MQCSRCGNILQNNARVTGKIRIPSSTVYGIILNNKKFKERLSRTDMISIQTLCTDGFTKIDVTLIYKIVKFFNLIPSPSRNWGAKPLVHEKEVGDDIERIRLTRNDLVHRIDCEVTDTELNAFFDEFIELGRRIDVYLGKPRDAGFEKHIAYYKTCPIDEYLEERYTKALQEIACLKEKARLRINEKVIHVYYGKATEELIRDIKDESASSSTPIRIIVKGIDGVEEKADLLNSLADQLNNGSASIQFKHARVGSIILHVTILDRILQHQETLYDELTNFLERVFRIGNIVEVNAVAEVNIILTVDEEVSNDMLRTDDIFQENIGGFLENILTKANGKQLFPENEVTAIVMPGANETQGEINSSADLVSAFSASFQNMDLDQERGDIQALTCKSLAELLRELELEIYHPDKIALIDIVKIQPSYFNIKLSNIPWLTFLDDLLGSDALLNRVNPIDLTVAVLNCCSPVVKQIIASKMFMCRLAIPFVFPQSRNEAMLVSLWPIRQIVIERELSHIGAVDCPCNVVSFVRIGYTSVSKSRMINEIISDQYHCTFFNKDSPLGSTTRWISNGLIEIAWYIPSTNSRLLSNVTACLNLRGDCNVHRQQLDFMSNLSDAIVIMVDIHEMKNERFMQLITEVYNTNAKVILSIDAIRCNKGVLRNELKTFLGKTTMYKDRTRINIMAVEGHRLQEGMCKEINVDENQIVYSAMREAADKITSFVPKMCSSIKAQLLPLQGEPWKEWSQNLKTVNKSSKYKTMQEKGLIRNKMIEARQTQFHICENLGPFMSMFIDKILQILPYEKESTVFVVWLKMFFDERSRNILPEYLERYKSKWQELKSAQDQKTLL